MPVRKGGSYYMRQGKPVLKERTGHKPESQQPTTAAKSTKAADSADVKKGKGDADA